MNRLHINYKLIISIISFMMISIPLFASTHTERGSQKKVIKIYNDFDGFKEQGDEIKIDMFTYTLDHIVRLDNTNHYKVTYILQEEINKTFDNLESFKEFGDRLQLNELQYSLMFIKRIGNTEKLIATYVLE